MIYRPWAYFGCARKLKVWIDGVHVGNIHTRKSETLEVTGAAHSIRVSMDWCKSTSFEMDAHDNERIELIAKTIWFPASLLLTFLWPQRVFSIARKKDI
jgi:hypothetical protein